MGIVAMMLNSLCGSILSYWLFGSLTWSENDLFSYMALTCTRRDAETVRPVGSSLVPERDTDTPLSQATSALAMPPRRLLKQRYRHFHTLSWY